MQNAGFRTRHVQLGKMAFKEGQRQQRMSGFLATTPYHQ
jgi:hypothetical protein